MSKNFYDLEQIRSIPIEDVCAAFGVDIYRKGRSKTCRLRVEKTPSVHLYTNNSNGQDSFYDFGGNYGGDVICFVSHVLGSDWQTALEQLASTFGIEPVNNSEYQTRNELTNYQYEKIGIQGDLATKNLDFDLERYSFESAQKFADKYNMSVNELRSQYPDFYARKILMNRALPFVTNLRNNYYTALYNHYSLAKSLHVSDPAKLSESFIERFDKLKNELSNAEKLLYRASKGTSLEDRISVRAYNVEEDYRALINGEIAFQIGSVSYNDIKQEAFKREEVVHYRAISVKDYESLQANLLNEIPHAAFLKGDRVNLAFLPEQSLAIEKALETLQEPRKLTELVTASAVPEKTSAKPREHQSFDINR